MRIAIPGSWSELTSEDRFTVAITTVWSGLGYLFSKDAVKILTKEEVRKRMARSYGNK